MSLCVYACFRNAGEREREGEGGREGGQFLFLCVYAWPRRGWKAKLNLIGGPMRHLKREFNYLDIIIILFFLLLNIVPELVEAVADRAGPFFFFFLILWALDETEKKKQNKSLVWKRRNSSKTKVSREYDQGSDSCLPSPSPHLPNPRGCDRSGFE